MARPDGLVHLPHLLGCILPIAWPISLPHPPRYYASHEVREAQESHALKSSPIGASHEVREVQESHALKSYPIDASHEVHEVQESHALISPLLPVRMASCTSRSSWDASFGEDGQDFSHILPTMSKYAFTAILSRII